MIITQTEINLVIRAGGDGPAVHAIIKKYSAHLESLKLILKHIPPMTFGSYKTRRLVMHYESLLETSEEEEEE